jgi:hypothetical protein
MARSDRARAPGARKKAELAANCIQLPIVVERSRDKLHSDWMIPFVPSHRARDGFGLPGVASAFGCATAARMEDMTITSNDAESPRSRAMTSATRVWAGQGTGQPCRLCGKPISPDDVQYDLEISEGAEGGEKRVRTLSFHLPCYDRWRDDGGR